VTVILNEAAIERFFHSEAGPMARLIARKASEIKAHAANVAPFRDGGLIVGLQTRGPFQDPDALFMLVGSDAVKPWKGHEPFNYPIAQELGGVTPGGVPYRNPFLVPGVLAAGFRPI
jgi:hypothetical protein